MPSTRSWSCFEAHPERYIIQRKLGLIQLILVRENARPNRPSQVVDDVHRLRERLVGDGAVECLVDHDRGVIKVREDVPAGPGPAGGLRQVRLEG